MCCNMYGLRPSQVQRLPRLNVSPWFAGDERLCNVIRLLKAGDWIKALQSKPLQSVVSREAHAWSVVEDTGPLDGGSKASPAHASVRLQHLSMTPKGCWRGAVLLHDFTCLAPLHLGIVMAMMVLHSLQVQWEHMILQDEDSANEHGLAQMLAAAAALHVFLQANLTGYLLLLCWADLLLFSSPCMRDTWSAWDPCRSSSRPAQEKCMHVSAQACDCEPARGLVRHRRLGSRCSNSVARSIKAGWRYHEPRCTEVSCVGIPDLHLSMSCVTATKSARAGWASPCLEAPVNGRAWISQCALLCMATSLKGMPSLRTHTMTVCTDLWRIGLSVCLHGALPCLWRHERTVMAHMSACSCGTWVQGTGGLWHSWAPAAKMWSAASGARSSSCWPARCSLAHQVCAQRPNNTSFLPGKSAPVFGAVHYLCSLLLPGMAPEPVAAR